MTIKASGSQFSSLPQPGFLSRASAMWANTKSAVAPEHADPAWAQTRSAEFNDRGMSYDQQAADSSLPYHVRVDQAEKARGNRAPWS